MAVYKNVIETLLDRIEESIVDEEEQYGIIKLIFMVLFILIILYGILTFYNVCKGKSLVEAVPCGKSCIEQVFGSCLVVFFMLCNDEL